MKSHLVDVKPRDGGIVVRLRGPYDVPEVDFWPTTGTCRQVGIDDAPALRRKPFTFAERLAFYGRT